MFSLIDWGRIGARFQSSLLFIATVALLIPYAVATILTNGGRSTWFLGVLVLMVYAIFGLTLYVLPPAT